MELGIRLSSFWGIFQQNFEDFLNQAKFVGLFTALVRIADDVRLVLIGMDSVDPRNPADQTLDEELMSRMVTNDNLIFNSLQDWYQLIMRVVTTDNKSD